MNVKGSVEETVKPYLGRAAPVEHESTWMGIRSPRSILGEIFSTLTPSTFRLPLNVEFASGTVFLELKAPGEADLLAK